MDFVKDVVKDFCGFVLLSLAFLGILTSVHGLSMLTGLFLGFSV